MAKKRYTQVEALKHKKAKRKNIPTAELENVMEEDIRTPIQVAYERRNTDLDPQLVWHKKEQQDETPLKVSVPPLYIQEKVQPKAIIEDLRRDTKARMEKVEPETIDMFNDFNGLPDIEAVTEFYKHNQNWSNRMICGDSMYVMASLSEREKLRGEVQCIYIDPPYGIKFNSNFQWSTKNTNVKDGVKEHYPREPEQVKAFRDTWSNEIHTYLSYLRDRLIVAKYLLSESGSIFIQIGDENVHRVRMLMEEVFGKDNFCGQITIQKTSSAGNTQVLSMVTDYVIWFAKDKGSVKYRQLYHEKLLGEGGSGQYVNYRNREDMSDCRLSETDEMPSSDDVFAADNLTSATGNKTTIFVQSVEGKSFQPKKGGWKTNATGMEKLLKASRLKVVGNGLMYRRYFNDFAAYPYNNVWTDTSSSFQRRDYVVQTIPKIVQRCLLMTTDPGDLVLDPTCGSGTTAYVAEQWGRRWITIDTSRVALALARSRLMGARYQYYILEDTPEGREKEAEISQTPKKTSPTNADIRHGFVCERVPHITLKSIANNSEIDAIWDRVQPIVDKALNDLNSALKNSAQTFQIANGARAGKVIDFNKNETEKLPSGEIVPHNKFLEWEVPRTAPQEWSKAAKSALEQFWKARIRRQDDIDKSIAAKADFEYLFDKPFTDISKTRVAGPFTVESLSPHRTPAVDQNDEHIDEMRIASKDLDIIKTREPAATEFISMILENLKNVGVQQANKEDRINFLSVTAGSGGGGGGGRFHLC